MEMSRSRSLARISDISLGMFLAIALMGLQRWALAELAGPILGILTAQFLPAFSFALFVILRLIDRDCEAAVFLGKNPAELVH